VGRWSIQTNAAEVVADPLFIFRRYVRSNCTVEHICSRLFPELLTAISHPESSADLSRARRYSACARWVCRESPASRRRPRGQVAQAIDDIGDQVEPVQHAAPCSSTRSKTSASLLVITLCRQFRRRGDLQFRTRKETGKGSARRGLYVTYADRAWPSKQCPPVEDCEIGGHHPLAGETARHSLNV
jgi:hypothetical protein